MIGAIVALVLISAVLAEQPIAQNIDLNQVHSMVYDTPFVTCLHNVTGDRNVDFDLLFPATKGTREKFTNNATGIIKAMQSEYLATFCRHIGDYSRCVQARLRADPFQKLAQFFDVDDFANTMSTYCSSVAEVTAGFDCALRSLGPVTCEGGVTDILKTITYDTTKTSDNGFGYSCGAINAAIKCRIEKQLDACDDKFVNVLDTVTTSLLSEDCTEHNFVSQHGILVTNLMPCIGPLALEVQNTGKTMDFEAMIGDICNAMEPMLACVEKKLKGSTKVVDQIVKKLGSLTNFKSIARYACSNKKLIAEQSFCVVGKIVATYSDNSNEFMDTCLGHVAEKYKSLNASIDHYADLSQNMDKLTSTMCDSVLPGAKCLEPMITHCSKELLSVFNKIAMDTSKTCHDPAFIVTNEEQKTGGTSCVGQSVLVTMATLTSYIYVTAHLLH